MEKNRLGKSKLISEFLAASTLSAMMKQEYGSMLHDGSITALLHGSAITSPHGGMGAEQEL
jgi:hypothetical protein